MLVLALCLLANAPPPPRAPPQEQPATDDGALHGDVTLGLRFVDVDGRRSQFDEDRNLDSGLFVRDVTIEGRPPAGSGPIERFLVRASGIGDPYSHVRLETVGGAWKTVGFYDRTRFAGNGQVDLHPFDVTRDSGSLSLEYAPAGGASRSSLEVGYLHRDGLSVGTRSVGISYVSGFPVRQVERDLSALGRWKTHFGELGVDVALGMDQSRSRDRREFALATPVFPNDPVSEDFAADVEGVGRQGELRLARAFDGGRLRFDAGLGWHAVERRGDLDSHEVGFAFIPALPSVRDTRGDLEFDGSDLEGDVGVAFELGEATDLELRYSREHEDDSGDLLSTVILDDLSGNPPTVAVSPSSLDSESRLGLFELGLTTSASRSVSLDLALEWGREELHVREIVEDVTTRFFDGTEGRLGARGSATVALGRSLDASLSGGHVRRPTETSAPTVGFAFPDERSTFAELAGRWRPRADTSLSATTRWEHLASDAFDSEADVLHHALSLSTAPSPEWSWNASLGYQTFDREAPTNYLTFDPGTGFTLVPDVVRFEGIERSASTSASFEVAPSFRPRASASAALSGGDSGYSYLTAALALPWTVSNRLEVGVEVEWLDFDGDVLLDDADYRATILALYVREGFGLPR